MHMSVKIFQVYSKCHLSILSDHFDGPLLVTSTTKESKQQNKKKTKRKQKTGTLAYREHKGKWKIIFAKLYDQK